jgi:nitrite reductase/ring-hydroxylating ferredoxin subunit
MAFKPVTRADALWNGETVGLAVDGHGVLLVRIDDAVFAYDDRCAHQGVALSTGRLDGVVLTCAAHQWCYDVRTGCGINPRGVALRSVPVRVEGGTILVDVDAGVAHGSA